MSLRTVGGIVDYPLTSMRRSLLSLLAAPAAAIAVLALPGTAFAHHVDVTGAVTCVAADGTYSVTWTVVVPAEDWASGQTVTVSASTGLSPTTLNPGQSASGTSVHSGPFATLTVSNVWSGGAVETDEGIVARPTTVCAVPSPAQTTIPASPTTTVPSTTVTTPPPTGSLGAVTTTTTTVAGAGSAIDLCPNVPGTQTSMPAGLTLVNGQCVASVQASPGAGAPAAGVGGVLPATGGSRMFSVLAAMFVALGVAITFASWRGRHQPSRTSPVLNRFDRFR